MKGIRSWIGGLGLDGMGVWELSCFWRVRWEVEGWCWHCCCFCSRCLIPLAENFLLWFWRWELQVGKVISWLGFAEEGRLEGILLKSILI